MGGNPIAGVNEAGYSKERHKEMLAIFSATYTPLKDWNIKANISAYTHDQTTKDRVKTYYLYIIFCIHHLFEKRRVLCV